MSRPIPTPPSRADRQTSSRAASRPAKDSQVGSPVHDIAFYESVAAELPESPALQSLLYTYRGSNSDQPVVEQIAEVDKHVATWVDAEKQFIASELKLIQERGQQELEDQKHEDDTRYTEIEDRIARINQCLGELEAERPRSIEFESDRLKQKRAELSSRQKERLDQTRERTQVFEDLEQTKRRHNSTLEHVNQRSKIELAECLQRGLLATEQEHGRISLVYQMANEADIALMVQHQREDVAKIQEAEASRANELRLWGQYLADRADRIAQINKAVASMLQNTQDSEKGLRFNITVEEQRSFDELEVQGAESQKRAAERLQYRLAMEEDQRLKDKQRAEEGKRRLESKETEHRDHLAEQEINDRNELVKQCEESRPAAPSPPPENPATPADAEERTSDADKDETSEAAEKEDAAPQAEEEEAPQSEEKKNPTASDEPTASPAEENATTKQNEGDDYEGDFE